MYKFMNDMVKDVFFYVKPKSWKNFKCSGSVL